MKAYTGEFLAVTLLAVGGLAIAGIQDRKNAGPQICPAKITDAVNANFKAQGIQVKDGYANIVVNNKPCYMSFSQK
ncbi:MAG: hypothetical protein DI551_02360 [Micavibrio aeruginosavorus]|uniref:Uncharacterized protein n=1 Tax=Micavibrio aeruginosavorus TaxID=349221 RepID=A0A2W5N622_9BACT|nr:MAG: hypothetical protein DI551_02360 [Micavibrio aeruginosavorus]